MKPKFEIGQKVKVSNDGEIGEVLSFSFDGEKFIYRISSKEVDIAVKEVINGVKTCGEDELKKIKEENA